MQVYLDEIGDLGWNFSAPYNNGGSSRYLTISHVITPKDKSKYVKRFVRDVYNKFHIPAAAELKGSLLNDNQKEYIVEKTTKLVSNYPDISILSVTVFKPESKRIHKARPK